LLAAPLSLSAKDDWQSDFQKWSASSQASPLCKVRYATGIFRPGLGAGPQWGFMTEKMFDWFSKEGVKLAPSVCPAAIGKASYRILLSETPVTTVSQTTHGAETQTTTQPFNADVKARTTYPDGSSANTTATVNGQQTSTVVVPTETTISRSSTALYMYGGKVQPSRPPAALTAKPESFSAPVGPGGCERYLLPAPHAQRTVKAEDLPENENRPPATAVGLNLVLHFSDGGTVWDGQPR
jgi:hypothetical protein